MDTPYSTCLVGVPQMGVPEAGLEPGEGAVQAPFSLPKQFKHSVMSSVATGVNI